MPLTGRSFLDFLCLDCLLGLADDDFLDVSIHLMLLCEDKHQVLHMENTPWLVGSYMYSWVGSYTFSRVGSYMYSQVGSYMYSRVGSYTYSRVGRYMYSRVGSYMYSRVGSYMHIPTLNFILVSLFNSGI